MLLSSLRRLRRRRGQFSLGGLCGCCAGGIPCTSCNLPETDLTLTLVGQILDCSTGTFSPYSVSFPFPYNSMTASWSTGCITGAPFSFSGGIYSPVFTLNCPTMILTVAIYSWGTSCTTGTGAGGAGSYFSSCSGGTTCGLLSFNPQFAGSSLTCSPLNITLTICQENTICEVLGSCLPDPNVNFTQAVITV